MKKIEHRIWFYNFLTVAMIIQTVLYGYLKGDVWLAISSLTSAYLFGDEAIRLANEKVKKDRDAP